MTEKFKDVPDYDGDYQVSNFGNVKSFKYGKERIRKPGVNKRGHLNVLLCKDGKVKTYGVHMLVAMAFLEHAPDGHKLVVDHKDSNPSNNYVGNLQLISQRENISRSKTDCGVTWFKSRNKWQSQIVIGGKRVYLGLFTEKQDGLDMYQKALASLHLFNGDDKQFRNQIL